MTTRDAMGLIEQTSKLGAEFGYAGVFKIDTDKLTLESASELIDHFNGKMVELRREIPAEIPPGEDRENMIRSACAPYHSVVDTLRFERRRLASVEHPDGIADTGLVITAAKVSDQARGTREQWPRMYIKPRGEDVWQNFLVGRRSRPWRIYRRMLPTLLEQFNLPADTTAEWSQYAGCSCPCSPGFILRHESLRSNGPTIRHYHVMVEPAVVEHTQPDAVQSNEESNR